MLIRVLLALTLLPGLCSCLRADPIPLIFDTDMGNDIDDALALSLIHALQSTGSCKLLAVTLTKDNRCAAPFVDLVNTFYGRGDIPIGVVPNGQTPGDGRFIRAIAQASDNGQPRYPHKLMDGSEAPEATALLRKTLAAQPDHSVVIVQVGFSTNLARLLDSAPDAVSPLDGVALVKKKVRLLSAMAGAFQTPPGKRPHREYNIIQDLPAAQKLFRDWPTPIVASGYEIGSAVLYPARSIQQDYRYVPHHPVADAYRLYGKMPYDRPSWDLTSVLYAVRPESNFFGLSVPGRITVEADGITRFDPDAAGSHRYLTLTAEQKTRVLDAFCGLCSRRPDGFSQREKELAAAARKIRVASTRTQPEQRVVLENQWLRLDFDPRASDTAYNYIWVRRPDAGRWERLFNFGNDVHADESRDKRQINCVGLNLSLQRESNAMRVKYPRPLIQYRQFDDKIGSPELIRRYPEIPPGEAKELVHADAAVEFRFELDPDRPCITVSGRITEGTIRFAICIINTLWTDNHASPTHEYIEGREEYDTSRPEAVACREVHVENGLCVLFYRHDGDGVPFAYVPLTRDKAIVTNFHDNWKCLYDFRRSALNQQFIPDNPPVMACNDVGWIAFPRPDQSLSAVRIVFFPELAWGKGGQGHALRARLMDSLRPYRMP